MQLATQLGGGFQLAQWPGTTGTNANASPQGPRTAAEQGFGVVAGGSPGAVSATTTGVLSVGTLALAALVWLWYSLPR